MWYKSEYNIIFWIKETVVIPEIGIHNEKSCLTVALQINVCPIIKDKNPMTITSILV